MNPTRVRLTFPQDLIRKPVLGEVVKRFDVLPNIRRADVSEDLGWIICELDGEPQNVADAIGWIENEGVLVDLLENPLES